MLKKYIVSLSVICFLYTASSSNWAQMDNMGQTIQINTRLNSFVGRPSWLLIIRDLDRGVNIPYLFEFTQGNHFWLAVTNSRNYVITVSSLQFAPLRRWPWITKKINNFCHLESNGRIMRGQSIRVTIQGDLTPNPGSYRCFVSRYKDTNFIIVKPIVKP